MQRIGNRQFERITEYSHRLREADAMLGEVRRCLAGNSNKIDEVMVPWCAERTNAQAVEELRKARIPAGPVLKPSEVLEDPHVQARELLKRVPFPGLPEDPLLANTPVRLSKSPCRARLCWCCAQSV